MFFTSFNQALKSYNSSGKSNLKIYLVTNANNIDEINDLLMKINNIKNERLQGVAAAVPTDDSVEMPLTLLSKEDKKEEEEADNCCICMDKIVNEKKLEKCGHKFCKECIDNHFKLAKPSCPICGTIYGFIKGTQPPGYMKVNRRPQSLPGYENCGTIEIIYVIPSGIQGVSSDWQMLILRL